MLTGLKILVAAGCFLAAMPALLGPDGSQFGVATTATVQNPMGRSLAASGQEPAREGDPFAAGYRARFSLLQLTDAGGQTHTIPARNLLHVRLLKVEHGAPLVEIFYRNGDYSLLTMQALHVIHRSESPAEDVLLSRAHVDGMRFPGVE